MKALRKWIRIHVPIVPSFCRNLLFSLKKDPSQCGEQNYLLKYFSSIENGLYIELGAFHPIYYSNSIGFKRKGWKGISYEANSDFKILWRIFRNSDRLVNKAVLPNRAVGDMTKFYFMERGVDGTSSALKEHATTHALRYGITTREAIIPSISIEEVLDNFLVKYSQPPDLMLVDIEGLDISILEVLCSQISISKLPKWLFMEVLNYDISPKVYSETYEIVGSVGPNVLFALKDK